MCAFTYDEAFEDVQEEMLVEQHLFIRQSVKLTDDRLSGSIYAKLHFYNWTPKETKRIRRSRKELKQPFSALSPPRTTLTINALSCEVSLSVSVKPFASHRGNNIWLEELGTRHRGELWVSGTKTHTGEENLQLKWLKCSTFPAEIRAASHCVPLMSCNQSAQYSEAASLSFCSSPPDGEAATHTSRRRTRMFVKSPRATTVSDAERRKRIG